MPPACPVAPGPIAGATGWAGRALVAGVLAADDLVLRSAIARSHAGEDLGTALGGERSGVPVYGSVDEGLEGVDVLIEYTSHTAVNPNTPRRSGAASAS